VVNRLLKYQLKKEEKVKSKRASMDEEELEKLQRGQVSSEGTKE
jgi:DNA-nicking Smr family endonuclease